MRTTFKYLRADSVAAAVELAAEHGTDGHYLAGGTDLYLDWKNGRRLDVAIDISHLKDLDYLATNDGLLRIGTLTSLRTLEQLPPKDHAQRALAALARVMCTPQTRTLATVGGNLCNASAAADLPPLLAVLDGTATLTGPAGTRTLAIEDIPTGPKRNSLAAGELLTEVSVSVAPRTGTAVERATRTALDIALVIVAASVSTDSTGLISRARICLGSVGPLLIRALEAEALLVGIDAAAVDAEMLEHVGALAADSSSPIDDVRTTAAYRRHSTQVLTTRAIRSALAQLQQDGTAA